MRAADGARVASQGHPARVGTVQGTLLGFDYGARRIGVAVGETATRIASPLGAIDAVASEARLREIDRLVGEWHPAALVVGLPRHAHGGEHEVAKLAQKFARRLAARYRLPVSFVDETLTSATAERTLALSRAGRRRAGDVDALAATLILQSWLDDLARG